MTSAKSPSSRPAASRKTALPVHRSLVPLVLQSPMARFPRQCNIRNRSCTNRRLHHHNPDRASSPLTLDLLKSNRRSVLWNDEEEEDLQRLIVQQYKRICQSRRTVVVAKAPAIEELCIENMIARTYDGGKSPENLDATPKERARGRPVLKKCDLCFAGKAALRAKSTGGRMQRAKINSQVLSPELAWRGSTGAKAEVKNKEKERARPAQANRMVSVRLAKTIRELRLNRVRAENPVLRREDERCVRQRMSPRFFLNFQAEHFGV